jgi:hypothetical protein
MTVDFEYRYDLALSVRFGGQCQHHSNDCHLSAGVVSIQRTRRMLLYTRLSIFLLSLLVLSIATPSMQLPNHAWTMSKSSDPNCVCDETNAAALHESDSLPTMTNYQLNTMKQMSVWKRFRWKWHFSNRAAPVKGAAAIAEHDLCCKRKLAALTFKSQRKDSRKRELMSSKSSKITFNFKGHGKGKGLRSYNSAPRDNPSKGKGSYPSWHVTLPEAKQPPLSTAKPVASPMWAWPPAWLRAGTPATCPPTTLPTGIQSEIFEPLPTPPPNDAVDPEPRLSTNCPMTSSNPPPFGLPFVWIEPITPTTLSPMTRTPEPPRNDDAPDPTSCRPITPERLTDAPEPAPSSPPSAQPMDRPVQDPLDDPTCSLLIEPQRVPIEGPFGTWLQFPSNEPSSKNLELVSNPSPPPRMENLEHDQPTFLRKTWTPSYQTLKPTQGQGPSDEVQGPSDDPSRPPVDGPYPGCTTTPQSAMPFDSPPLASPDPTSMISFPTPDPSFTPSVDRTGEPSMAPSEPPSNEPSSSPSKDPTDGPSTTPTKHPSNEPSTPPSAIPTVDPSNTPSESPSNLPSTGPTDYPSSQPSLVPSSAPSSSPTTVPSAVPSITPSDSPTATPSSIPSEEPFVPPAILQCDQPSSSPAGTELGKPLPKPPVDCESACEAWVYDNCVSMDSTGKWVQPCKVKPQVNDRRLATFLESMELHITALSSEEQINIRSKLVDAYQMILDHH